MLDEYAHQLKVCVSACGLTGMKMNVPCGVCCVVCCDTSRYGLS